LTQTVLPEQDCLAGHRYKRPVRDGWLLFNGKKPGGKSVALRLEDKKALGAEVNEVAKGALSAVAAEYRGLTVEQMTSFRSKARAAGVYVRVVKNTLAKRAVEGTDFECLKDALTGPLVLAFSSEDPGAAARIVKDFAKENDK